jgi:ATP-dependent RNA helicase DDX49/DBP8
VLQYPGHLHDWVVFEDRSDALPLQQSYLKQDLSFSLEHIEESVVEDSTLGCEDPRWVPQRDAVAQANNSFRLRTR